MELTSPPDEQLARKGKVSVEARTTIHRGHLALVERLRTADLFPCTRPDSRPCAECLPNSTSLSPNGDPRRRCYVQIQGGIPYTRNIGLGNPIFTTSSGTSRARRSCRGANCLLFE